VVLDQSGYHTSQHSKDGALLRGIELHPCFAAKKVMAGIELMQLKDNSCWKAKIIYLLQKKFTLARQIHLV
jgi:hypothetical protein